MTFDFSHLEMGDTVWIDLPELSAGARVCVKPATENNKPYFNAMLKRSGLRARRIARTDRIRPEDAAQNRSEDRDLFPKHVIVGWENILDTSRNPVPFEPDNVKEFCAKLPDYLFDRIRNAASTPERFVDDELPDPEELAGNSPAGSGGS